MTYEPPPAKNAVQRRPLQLADMAWIENQHQTCADCLRPQRFDYSADDKQWDRVVGHPGLTLCIECYLRRCDAAGEEGGHFDSRFFAGRTMNSFG